MSERQAGAQGLVVPAAVLGADRVAAVEVHAAGGVVWRPTSSEAEAETGVEVLVIHRPRYDDWSLPKGKLDEGESFQDGAIREIHEETGVSGSLGADLGAVFYTDHKGRSKVVRWWAVRAGVVGEPTDTEEVDEFRWDSLDAVDELLSYDTDRAVLEVFRGTVAA
ncbi:NUDIX hydrolase [Euzebya tangerina]|uniref:NUDIX hydrolase n=1 Tax=Euzebya tangerina TaxID=591198 RepID=UPI00196AFEB5|nr:NUDIX hydrolase [Euzebya tangerina]